MWVDSIWNCSRNFDYKLFLSHVIQDQPASFMNTQHVYFFSPCIIWSLHGSYNTHPSPLVPYNHAYPKWGLIHRDRVMQLMKHALYLQATTAGYLRLLCGQSITLGMSNSDTNSGLGGHLSLKEILFMTNEKLPETQHSATKEKIKIFDIFICYTTSSWSNFTSEW